MRILVGADVPCDPNSGASGTVFQTNRALRELGHSVDELWADDLKRRIEHGNLHYLLELPFVYRKHVRRKHVCNGYDVIELNQPHAYLTAKHFKQHIDAPVVVVRSQGVEIMADEIVDRWKNHLEVFDRSYLRRSLSRLLKRLLDLHWYQVAKYADGVIVSATDNAEYLQQRLNIANSRISVVPMGVPNLFLGSLPPRLSSERLSRMLFVGQYAFFKGPTILARMVDRLLEHGPDLTFSWVCNRDDHERALELFSDSVKSRVRLLSYRSQEKLMAIYDTHGIFLFPSIFEGFGKAPLEAMSRGLCVFASNVGGMRDYISHGKNGHLYDVGDVESLAADVFSLVNDLPTAQEIADQARRTACAYTWRHGAELCIAFYNELLKTKRSSTLR